MPVALPAKWKGESIWNRYPVFAWRFILPPGVFYRPKGKRTFRTYFAISKRTVAGDKVYLESYRDGRALDDTVLRAAKSFFEEKRCRKLPVL